MPVPEWVKEVLAKPAAIVEERGPDPEEGLSSISPEVADEVEYEDTEPYENEDVEPEPYEEPVEEEAKEAEPLRAARTFHLDVRGATLRTFAEQVGSLADEVCVVVTSDGIRAKTVDPAHVAMIEVRADIQDVYEQKDDRPYPIAEDVRVGVDLDKLTSLLKRAKDEPIHVRMDLPNGGDKDELTFDVPGMRRTMPALDTAGMTEPRIPELQLDATFSVAAKDLLAAIKAASEISDHVVLTATSEGVRVSSEGDTDKVDMPLPVPVEFVVGKDKAKSMFPIDYLENFLKVVKGERLVVRLGTDYPLRADWEGTTKGTFLLAPRIESSE